MDYTDDELLEAIQGEDRRRRNAALRQLYLDPVILSKIKGYLSVYGQEKQEPDDILQEGVILLDELIRTGKFQAKSKVRTFLIGICHNLARSGMKKVDRVVLKGELVESEQGEETSPEDQIIFREKSEMAARRDEILRQLVGQLTDNCREVLNLYYFLSCSMAKVAEERGLKNAHQAKKAASRCREQLRNLIREQPEFANFLKHSI